MIMDRLQQPEKLPSSFTSLWQQLCLFYDFLSVSFTCPPGVFQHLTHGMVVLMQQSKGLRKRQRIFHLAFILWQLFDCMMANVEVELKLLFCCCKPDYKRCLRSYPPLNLCRITHAPARTLFLMLKRKTYTWVCASQIESACLAYCWEALWAAWRGA